MLTVAGVAALTDGVIAMLGDGLPGVHPQRVSMFAPPGWIVGGVWVILFGLLGLARWRLVRLGSATGRQGARWVIAFVAVCTLYPVYTLGLRSLTAGLVGNLGTMLFAIVLGLRFWRVDPVSVGVFALVAGWLSYATLIVAVQLIGLRAV